MKLGEEEGEEPAAVKQEPQGSVDGAAGVTGFFFVSFSPHYKRLKTNLRI